MTIKEMLSNLLEGYYCGECYGCCGDNSITISCKEMMTKFEEDFFKYYQEKECGEYGKTTTN